jgi:O-antigen ligase
VTDRLQTWSAHFLALVMAIAVSAMFIPRPWINPSLFQIGLLLLGIVWTISLAIHPRRLRLSLPMLPLAGAVLWGLLQLGTHWTSGRADTRAAVLIWLGNLLAFVLVAQVCASPRVRRQFLDALLYFAFVLSIVATMHLLPIGDSTSMGPFVNHDQYAAFIEMVLPLALVRALDGGSRAMRFSIISAALFASAIAAASRAGALLATAEIVVVPLALWGRRFRLPTRSVGALWLLALVSVAVAGWAALWGRFQDPDPLRGRRVMLTDTIAMIRSRPWTGFGLGTFRTVYPAYASVDFGAVVNHAHNDWAEWTADGAIPFGLLLLSIAIWSIPKAFRTVWGIGLLAVFIHATVDFPLQKPVLELWLFALLGALSTEGAITREAIAGSY